MRLRAARAAAAEIGLRAAAGMVHVFGMATGRRV
jgi:hypothetical protein